MGSINKLITNYHLLLHTMPIEQQTSRYLPIWLQLKKNKECSVTAPPQFHVRIIKAVKKRRDKDVAFLYQLAESGHKHFIKFKIEGTVIKFTLRIELDISAL